MKRRLTCFIFLIILLLAACPAVAQEPPMAPAATMTAPDEPMPSLFPPFWNVVMSSTSVGLLNWFCIFFWALAALPLGIASVIQAATSRIRQRPLAMKLLIVGGLWELILGLVGFTQGAIFSFATLATMSSAGAQQAMLAFNISQSLYSIAVALFFCQIYLFFFLVSIVILHIRNRNQ